MGTIGVRCSDHHGTLWFHLDVPFATGCLDPEFRVDGEDRELNALLRRQHPWEKLTEVGKAITLQVLAIRGVRAINARPDYFSLWIDNERDWQRIFPAVLQIIRKETNDPRASVVSRPNEVTPVPQWHLSLLQRFG